MRAREIVAVAAFSLSLSLPRRRSFLRAPTGNKKNGRSTKITSLFQVRLVLFFLVATDTTRIFIVTWGGASPLLSEEWPKGWQKKRRLCAWWRHDKMDRVNVALRGIDGYRGLSAAMIK